MRLLALVTSFLVAALSASVHAMEVVAQGPASDAASNMVLNSKIGNVEGNLTGTNAVVQQLVQRNTDLQNRISRTELILQQIIQYNGSPVNGLSSIGSGNVGSVTAKSDEAAGTLCGFINFTGASAGPGYERYDQYVATSAGSPCKGVPLMVRSGYYNYYRTQCPAGYTFMQISADTSNPVPGPDNTWNTGSGSNTGSCVKN